MTRRIAPAIILLAAALGAQQTVAPTAEPVGPPLGENAAGYNITNSVEVGYRFRSLAGDEGKYRSDVNFGNGVRLLSGTLTIHSREGHGRFFDTVLLRALGLGNDPYEMSSLRVEKNRFYRYDLVWRLNDYFNPALRIADGLHRIDTTRTLQDHDLTLLPQFPFRLFVGYTRNRQDGPALTTVQGFQAHGDVFPVFSDVRRLRNEYRFGNEIHLFGFVFNWMRGWNNFSETTFDLLGTPSGGILPGDPAALDQFRRAHPYHGEAPYWRLNLRTGRRYWAAHGRFTYADGRRSFFFDETAVGTNRFGAAQNRQVLVLGDGRRPVGSGNLVLSAFPSKRLTISNQTSFNNIRMEGEASYRELNNATLGLQLADFQLLGIRLITNLTDATYRAAKWLGLYGGFHFSNRRIRSVEVQDLLAQVESRRFEQENTLKDGLFGIRFQPAGPLTVNLDAEVGRADRPVYPIAPRRYHLLGARVQYKVGSLLLSGAARSDYNVNSISLASHSSRARNYAFDASWAPRGWLAFDAGYTKNHLDTLSAIAYFAGGFDPITGNRSIYISNIHAGALNAHLSFGRLADLSIGYSRVEDAGGEARPPGTSGPVPVLAALTAAQTYPLTFETPLARLSVRLRGNVRFNVGYQFYRYREEFFNLQGYRAHTGYTSVLWSF